VELVELVVAEGWCHVLMGLSAAKPVPAAVAAVVLGQKLVAPVELVWEERRQVSGHLHQYLGRKSILSPQIL